jgi:hypothetical protein
MKFKCNKCGGTDLIFFRERREYDQSENWENTPIFGVDWKKRTTPTLIYKAECSRCGKTWGPRWSLLALRSLMILDGVVLENEKV